MKCSVLWHLLDKCGHFCFHLIIYLDIHLYVISCFPLHGLVYLQPKSRNNNMMFGRGGGGGGGVLLRIQDLLWGVFVYVHACVFMFIANRGCWDERGMLSVYDYVSCDPNAILGEYKHCCTLWLFRWGSARHPVRSGRGQISDHHSYPPTPLYTTDSLKYNIQFFLVYCHTPCGYHQDMQLSCKIVCIYLISMWWQNRYS